jgi:hypothetical protein
MTFSEKAKFSIQLFKAMFALSSDGFTQSTVEIGKAQRLCGGNGAQ